MVKQQDSTNWEVLIKIVFLGDWTNYSKNEFPHKAQYVMSKEKYTQKSTDNTSLKASLVLLKITVQRTTLSGTF